VVIGDGERRQRYILCYNPKEAGRQKKHREEVVRFLALIKGASEELQISNFSTSAYRF